MEFITGGDMMFYIQIHCSFTEAWACFYTAEVLLGIWFMHQRGVIYRDLKLDNVMIAGDGHIKLTDFGMCKENMGMGSQHGHDGLAITKTFCGTPDYLAPELIKRNGYTLTLDFWTVGVLLFEMIMGEAPFEGDDDSELFDNIVTAPIIVDPRFKKETRTCILGFMTRSPENRLGAGRSGKRDVMDHPFFRALDWEKLASKKIKPPFVPKSGKKALNFDAEFTMQKAVITPIGKTTVDDVDQDLFKEFDYETSLSEA